MVFREKTPDGTTRLTGARFNPIDAWPVNSIFFGYTATNPATLLGGGTWSQISQGRMLVGQNPADADFDVLGDTGGAKTHTLTDAEMPSHAHTMYHFHHIKRSTVSGGSGSTQVRGGANDVPGDAATTSTTDEGNNTTGVNGGDAPHNNMPPFLVVYIWRRTA